MSLMRRILVVDDDARNRAILCEILRSLGHVPVPAGDGSQTLEIVHHEIDLVLLDVIMPDMDGYEVAKAIRQDPSVHDIPIIMVTVLDAKEDRLKAVEAGANDFISKPIDRLELKVRMALLLKLKDTRDKLKRHLSNLEEAVKRRTAALAESEQRFRAMFDSAQDLIFVKDNRFRYTEVNPAMIEFLAIPRAEILGKTDEDLFDREHAQRIRDLETRVLAGQIIETEQHFTYQSRCTALDFIRIPMRDTSGQVTGICGIGRDVTERIVVAQTNDVDKGEYPSKAMQSTLASARLGAVGDTIILITGESGSGKDHLARRIHALSPRSAGPYHAVNCAAIYNELAESELFGHEAGAFTGANRRKRGILELAEGGTLLLNEIGELSLPIQAKLLSFLDTWSITRVGGEKQITVNARVIAATNRDLQKAVTEGTFRKDLYYRLNVFSIEVPPLRERPEDIPVLSTEIMEKIAAQMQMFPVPRVTPQVIELFKSYTWPGNVRELRNVIERAVILSNGGPVCPEHVKLDITKGTKVPIDPDLSGSLSLDESVADLERTLITEALKRCNKKIAPAARLLGITRYALARHMKKLDITGR